MKLICSLLVLSSSCVWTHACDIEAYKRCVNAFTTKHPTLSNEVVPGFEAHEFEQVCSDYKTWVACTEPNIQGCSEEDQMVWKISKDGMDYTCGPRTKSILKTDATCVKSDELLQAVKLCNKTMIGDLAQIQRTGEGDVCKVMNNYKRCTVDKTNVICGPRVSDWISGMIDSVMKPVKKFGHCGQLPRFAIYGATAAGIFVLVVLTVVVTRCVRKSKKQTDNPYGKMDA